MPLQSRLKDKLLSQKKNVFGPYKTSFKNCLILKTISDKNRETRTTSPYSLFIAILLVQDCPDLSLMVV